MVTGNMTDQAMLALAAAFGPGLPQDQWREFSGLFRSRKVDRKAHFLHVGDRASTLGFVVSGLFRLYYTRSDGREFNKSFVAEGHFIAALESLLSGEASRVAFEALEDAELLVAPYEQVAAFYERDMFWQRFGRLHAERLLLRKVRREESLLLDPAPVRYEDFLREHGAIEGRVPAYHVASYLGITPEALSRIKAKRPAGSSHE
jgi:CRP/FNR family transcriptional regulator, anaerobic regulatory protein